MKLLFIVVLSLLAVSYAWEKKAEPRTKNRAEDKKQTREQETEPRTKNRAEDKKQTREQETAAGSHNS